MDSATEMVVFIDLAVPGNGGLWMRVRVVREGSDRAHVRYYEDVPIPPCPLTQTTRPVVVIAIPRVPGEVTIEGEVRRIECPPVGGESPRPLEAISTRGWSLSPLCHPA